MPQKRWYQRIKTYDDGAKRLVVEIYDADYYDSTGLLQDSDITGLLPAELRDALSEESELVFHFDGGTEEFCDLMHCHEIVGMLEQ